MSRQVDGELGVFLRSRRERMDPAAVDLFPGRHRRTPGLRREEVAQRAGVSVEWYARLEQGRGGAPSAAVLHSLAEALVLTPTEVEHMFLLAYGRPREDPRGPRSVVPPRFWQVLAGFPHSPAYIKTPSWDVIAWNDAARAVLTDYGTLPVRERNVLRILFTDPASRIRVLDWEREARLAVSTFRLELTRWGGHEAHSLIQSLQHDSPDFARMWEANDVGTLGQGTKQMRHSVAGDLAMWYSSYAIDDEPGLGLVLYTPESEADVRGIQGLLEPPARAATDDAD